MKNTTKMGATFRTQPFAITRFSRISRAVRKGHLTAVAAIVLTACGGGGGSPPAPTPTPAPTPAPAPTPTPTPLSSIQKLKAAVALGAALQVDPVPVIVTTGPVSTVPGAVVIAPTDPRIRLLGGRYVTGVTGGISFSNAQALTQSHLEIPFDQYSPYRTGLNIGFEFVLPAGQTTFEYHSTESGYGYPLTLLVNGRMTNEAGYQLNHTGGCCQRFTRVVMPPSSAARLITVNTPTPSFGGLRLPAGDTIGTLPSAANYATVVAEGDSITEGAVASMMPRTWAMQAAYRLGIQNPIIVAQGCTGYVVTCAGRPTIPQRIDDVLKAVNGGPPDMAVIAAGINDCGDDPGPVAAAALSYFRALRAGAPQMPIVVLGPFGVHSDSYLPRLANCQAAIFASAQQVSLTYTVPVDDWVTAANKDTVFGPGAPNGPHPTDAGHAIYGQRAADAIRAIILALP